LNIAEAVFHGSCKANGRPAGALQMWTKRPS
jgi:hypothetical protein